MILIKGDARSLADQLELSSREVRDIARDKILRIHGEGCLLSIIVGSDNLFHATIDDDNEYIDTAQAKDRYDLNKHTLPNSRKVQRVFRNVYRVLSNENDWREEEDEDEIVNEDADVETKDGVDFADILSQDRTATLTDGSTPIIDRGAYRYDSSRDEYTFPVKRNGTMMLEHVSGQEIRAWFEYYTTAGIRVQDVLRKFEIDRQTFLSIKNSLALTKSSLGLTDEEIASNNEENLVRSLLRKKEKRVVIEADKRYQSVLEAQARKGRDAEALLAEVFSSITIPPLRQTYRIHLGESRHKGAIFPVADYHIGKHNHANSNYRLQDQIVEYEEMTLNVIDKIESWGEMDFVVYAMLGDFFHVDTDRQQTTSQRNNLGESMTCTSREMVEAGTRFAIWQIETLMRELNKPIIFASVPGNHDRLLHSALSTFIQMYFEKQDGFNANRMSSEKTNHLILPVDGYGCFLFTHTDEINDGSAVSYLNRFRPSTVPMENCAVIGGDKHAFNAKDIYGIKRYICSSPSPIDSWHSSKGYVTTREHSVFLLERDYGITQIGFVRVERGVQR